jgi:hypothetical protein
VLERADAEAWAQKLLIDPNSEVYLCALTLLLLRRYWYRIWIIQEVSSARQVTVYCGLNSIRLTEFMKARDYIRLQCFTTGLSSITIPYFFRVLNTEGPIVY